MRIKQVELQKGQEHRYVWLDNISNLKPGKKIKIKGETEFWTIKHVFEPERDKGEANRNWHVGGL